MYSIQSWCVHSDIINMFHAFVEFYEKFKIHQDTTNIVLCKNFQLSIFSHESNSRIANVCPLVSLSVCNKNPTASQNCSYQPLSLSTIEPINRWAYQPASLLTIKPINHRTYQPSSLSTIKAINHQVCQP